MLHIPANQYGRIVTSGSSLNNWGPTVISGPQNQYGDWIQTNPGLPYESSSLFIAIGTLFSSGNRRAAYIDFAYGPDSSNLTVVLPYLNGTNSGGMTNGCIFYYLPLCIPPNQPLWSRHQNYKSSGSTPVVIHTTMQCGRTMPYYPRVYRYEPLSSLDTSTTTATLITPGTSGEGAWTEMIASTPKKYIGTLLAGLYTFNNNLNAAAYTGDVGIGPSGSEQVLVENSFSMTQQTTETSQGFTTAFYNDIPAGSRLSARVSCSATPSNNVSVLLYGMIGG
jgi:hypothetical protein